MQALPIDSIQWPQLFANLVIGQLNLLIPQSDIFSLEPAIEMRPGSASPLALGEIDRSGQRWPLYAFDADLNLLSAWPESYRIAILLKNVTPIYGLLCEQVYSMERSTFILQPVPECMRTEHSPLLALVLYNNEVRSLSSGAALAPLLQQQAGTGSNSD